MKPLSRSEVQRLYGAYNYIDRTAIIYPGVIIGKGNYIGPQCIIGSPAEKIGFFHCVGRVFIGDNNRFTKQVTIDSGTEFLTRIDGDCIFLKNAHIGHDAEIGINVILSCNVSIGGWCSIDHNVGMGLGAMTHPRTKVKHHCYLGMGCVYLKNTEVAPGMTYVGNPAMILGPNKKAKQ